MTKHLEVDLPAFHGSLAFDGAQDTVFLSDAGIGDRTTDVNVDGNRIIGVDVNPLDGRRFDMVLTAPSEGDIQVTVSPVLDVQVEFAMHHVQDDMEDELPDVLADDTIGVLLDDAEAPAIRTRPWTGTRRSRWLRHADALERHDGGGRHHHRGHVHRTHRGGDGLTSGWAARGPLRRRAERKDSRRRCSSRAPPPRWEVTSMWHRTAPDHRPHCVRPRTGVEMRRQRAHIPAPSRPPPADAGTALRVEAVGMRPSRNRCAPGRPPPSPGDLEMVRACAFRRAGRPAASVSGEQLVASNVNDFMKTNLYKAMVRLVDKEGWDPEFAASWLGQAVVETGKPNLEKLDVVEHGTGIGRGMLQYSYSRRGPYDRARAQALQQGQDPNDINWQIDYALKKDNAGMNLDAMRQGLTDPKQNYRFQPGWGTASGFTLTESPTETASRTPIR